MRGAPMPAEIAERLNDDPPGLAALLNDDPTTDAAFRAFLTTT